jgi:hypothetical protein
MKSRIAMAAILLSANISAVWAFPWYASGEGIRGAQLMTEEERHKYVHDLQSMHSMQECQAYMHDHEYALETRAKVKGVALPPVKGDPCEVMQIMGRFR